jgi:hypothetical protein
MELNGTEVPTYLETDPCWAVLDHASATLSPALVDILLVWATVVGSMYLAAVY